MIGLLHFRSGYACYVEKGYWWSVRTLRIDEWLVRAVQAMHKNTVKNN